MLSHHQQEDTTLQSTSSIDVHLTPQGHHMITTHKAKEVICCSQQQEDLEGTKYY